MESASRTRDALGERMFETTWTTRDNFFKGPGGQLRPAEGGEWEAGGKKKDKQDKGEQDCGREAGGERKGIYKNGEKTASRTESGDWKADVTSDLLEA